MHLLREPVSGGKLFHESRLIARNALEQRHTPASGPLQHRLPCGLGVLDRLCAVLSRELERARPGIEQQQRSMCARKKSIVSNAAFRRRG